MHLIHEWLGINNIRLHDLNDPLVILLVLNIAQKTLNFFMSVTCVCTVGSCLILNILLHSRKLTDGLILYSLLLADSSSALTVGDILL